MSQPIILLINRGLPYNCVGKLTGFSGVEYGTSVYEEAFAGHVCRMSLEQWRACKTDVTNGLRRQWAQWEIDIELPDSPVGGEDVLARIRDASPDQLDAIVASLSPLVQAAYKRAKEGAWHRTEAPEGPELLPATGISNGTIPTACGHTAESLALITNYRVLLKAAREAGVENPDRFDSTPALREAILAKQLQPA